MGWLRQLFSRRRRYHELSESIREHLDAILDLIALAQRDRVALRIDQPARLQEEHLRADVFRHRTGNHLQRLAESVVRIRHRRLVRPHGGDAIERAEQLRLVGALLRAV